MADTGVQGTGVGLSGGGLGGDGAEIDVGDFCCPSYLSLMLEAIRRRWDRNQRVTGSVVVRFTVDRSGEIDDVGVDRSSGYLALDMSAQRAVRAHARPAATPSGSSGRRTCRCVSRSSTNHDQTSSSLPAVRGGGHGRRVAALRAAVAATRSAVACADRGRPHHRRSHRCTTPSGRARLPRASRTTRKPSTQLPPSPRSCSTISNSNGSSALLPRDTYRTIPRARSLTDVPLNAWQELGADGVVSCSTSRQADGRLLVLGRLERA